MRDKIVDTLVTSRLRLRPFTPEDREAMIALQGDPEVMRYYGNGRPLEADQVDLVLDSHIKCRPKGYWAWAVTLLNNPKCFGQITAMSIDWRDEPWIELGWLLAPSLWGRGYATEAVGAVLQHGMTELGWRKIMAGADVRNMRSQRVMLKCGLRPAGEELDAYGNTRRVYTRVA